MNLKIIILSLLYIFILHFEGNVFFGIKFSHLWKVIFFIYVLYQFKDFKKLNSPANIFIYFFILTIINSVARGNFFDDLIYNLYIIIFPSIVLLLYNKMSIKAYVVLTNLCYTIVIVLLFYFFGLFESNYVSGYDYETINFSPVVGFVGPFQTSHLCSIFCSFLSIFYMYDFMKFKRKISLFFLIITLFLMLSTYVRTGIIMSFFGILYLLFKEFRLSRLFLPILLSSIFILYSGLEYLNPFLIRFFEDFDLYSSNNLSKLGSGRYYIWNEYLSNYNPKFLDILFGYGRTEQLDLIESSFFGLRLIPHNGFIELFFFNGLICSIIYVFVMLKFLFYSIKHNNSLLGAYIFSLLPYLAFQSYTIIHTSIFISLAFLITKQKHK